MLCVRRGDFERFAGSRLHGPEGQGFDVLSICARKDCPRYAPGVRCREHGGTPEPLHRKLRSIEKTAFHESGHAHIGAAVGWTGISASIIGRADANGRAEGMAPLPDSLAELTNLLTVQLGGPIAASMAAREDWRQLDFAWEREAEGPSPDYLRATAQNVQFGIDRAAATRWLEQVTPEAARKAHRILDNCWNAVTLDALRLLQKGAIEL